MLKSREIITDYWRSKIEYSPKPKSLSWILLSILESYNLSLPLSSADHLKLWRTEIAFFFVEVFGIVPWVDPMHPFSDQLAILEAVRKDNRVSVRSGHKVSKSNSLAGIAYWYFLTRPMARVPITSASYSQVRKINWYELKNMFVAAERRGSPIGAQFFEDPQSGIKSHDGREIFGFSTKEAERAAGISGKNIKYLLDEGSGIEEMIFEAIEGNRAGGASIAMFSNPTKTHGTFYQSFHGKRQFWTNIHISSEYTPNCQAGRTIVPGLAEPEWIQEKKDEWGEDSPLYHVRVKGNFPPQGPNSVISIELVELAAMRYRVWYESESSYYGDLIIGVDPAYYGDDEAVIYGTRNNIAIPPVVFQISSGPQIAQGVIEYAKKYGSDSRSVRINVDSNGEGKAVYEILAFNQNQMLKNIRAYAVPVNVSDMSDYPNEYYNKRTQLAFGLKKWLEDGGALPEDPKLESELVSVGYIIDHKGRYKLPTKDKEKEQLGRSPDRRNALELAVYQGPAYEMGYSSAGPRETTSSNLSGMMGY